MAKPKKTPEEVSAQRRDAVAVRWKKPSARKRQAELMKEAWDARRRAIAAAMKGNA